MPQCGAHISTSGIGVAEALRLAQQVGMTACQIFTGSPQRFVVKTVSDVEAEAVKSLCSDCPLFLHAAYVALPTVPAEKRLATLKYYRECDELAHRLGARGVVIHSGSYGEGKTREDGITRVREMLCIMHTMPIKTSIILENVAGLGTSLGRQPSDLMEMVAGFDKAFVCWDTAHAYAQGVDITSLDTIRACILTLGQKLACIHLNGVSSKVKLGSHLDRHELMCFDPVLGQEALLVEWIKANVPMIVEASEGRNAIDDLHYLKMVADKLNQAPDIGIKVGSVQ